MHASYAPATEDTVTLRQRARWLTADMDTPISLFLGMARQEPGILLESAEVDGRWGRYSILACDILLSLSCRDGLLALDIRDSRLTSLRDLDGLPYVNGVRAAMRRLTLSAPDAADAPGAPADLPPITRALYGYFGYGMAGLFNPKPAAVLPPREAAACLVLPGTVLLFDHLYNRLCQLSLGEHRPVAGAHATSCITAPEAPAPDITAVPGEAGYKAAVQRIKELLRRGEAIQVVPSCNFSTPYAGDLFDLYRRMRRCNASPYMFFMRLPEITLFGSSPEVMVRCTAGRLQLSPIAGTRRRGEDDAEDARLAAELREDPKERAEHVMLVDLGRNDLGRIARPGTIAVERLMEVEYFSHVMHLTSRITGRLREDLDALDVLASTFPAGTVSGAPKVRAMEIIADVEQRSRGPYAGCIGWLGLDKDSVHLDTGITIRSMWFRDGRLHWQAGGGIVFDSDPDAEWREVRNKSAIMRTVLTTTGERHVSSHR